MKNFKLSSLWLAPLFAVLAACGGGGGGGASTTTPTVATLKSIAITPAQSATMVINTSQQLTATGTYSDGTSRTLTGLTWATRSGGATVVQAASSGIVAAKGTGTDTVTATSTADNIAGTIALTVTAPWTQFAAGGNQTVGLKADGKMYSWGSNIRGQLGDGTSDNRNAPVSISGGSTLWKQVSVGDRFVVAIRTDGTLWAWGYNLNGQLGDGTQVDKLVPTQIGVAKDWYMVAAGQAHVVALKASTVAGTASYTLYAWGSNYKGQLGDGTVVDKLIPTKIGTANWLTIAAGQTHTVGIQRNQTLWTWGDSSFGQTGNGSSSGTVLAPTQVGTMTWSSVAAGAQHTLAINSDRTLYAWGAGATGQLGNNGTSMQTAPVPVGTANNWAQVTGGMDHSMGVRDDGTLWGWGSNREGQLGDGGTDSLQPVQIGNLTTWKSVSAGAFHTAALKADSTLWTFGRNAEGQLGIGNNNLSSIPVTVPY